MIDLITIKNNTHKLNKKNFGDYYNKSVRINSTNDYKYRLYKEDLEIFYSDENDDDVADIRERDKDEYFLTLSVNDTCGFSIMGSLRKWWFGSKAASQDFNCLTFLKCIRLLAKKLGVEEKVLWKCSVNRLEIGGSIKLKAEYKNLIGSVSSYPNRKRFGDFSETVYFKANHSELIIYDKINELQAKGKIKSSTKKKLKKGVFIVRLEIKLKTLSKTKFSGYIQTLEDIKANWLILLDEWEAHFSKVNFTPYAPPKLADKEFLTLTEIKNFLIQIGIREYGMEQLENLIRKQTPVNKRSENIKKLREINNMNLEDEFVEYLSGFITSFEGKKTKMARYYDVVNG